MALHFRRSESQHPRPSSSSVSISCSHFQREKLLFALSNFKNTKGRRHYLAYYGINSCNLLEQQQQNMLLFGDNKTIGVQSLYKSMTKNQQMNDNLNCEPDINTIMKNVVVSPSGEVIVLPESVSFGFDPSKHPIEERQQQHDPATANTYNNILQRQVSLELLNPTHNCHTRKSSMTVAIINLVATVCGGGVLSLPLAFRRAGIIPTTIFMIYAVLTTDFSLYILISCARRTGGRSYGDVAKAAFGNACEVATTSLLAVMLTGGTTAYQVLVKDIWTPVLVSLLPTFWKSPFLRHDDTITIGMSDGGVDGNIAIDHQEDRVSKRGAAIILLFILIAGAPLLLKRDLHALRHTCYVGFSSCTLLMVAVVYRAYQAVTSPDQEHRPPLNWYSTDISDLAFAFPIVVLCFFCSYNALGVHSSMLNPTRERVKVVLDKSMMLCFA
jgi:hypothetical protein